MSGWPQHGLLVECLLESMWRPHRGHTTSVGALGNPCMSTQIHTCLQKATEYFWTCSKFVCGLLWMSADLCRHTQIHQGLCRCCMASLWNNTYASTQSPCQDCALSHEQCNFRLEIRACMYLPQVP